MSVLYCIVQANYGIQYVIKYVFIELYWESTASLGDLDHFMIPLSTIICLLILWSLQDHVHIVKVDQQLLSCMNLFIRNVVPFYCMMQVHSFSTFKSLVHYLAVLLKYVYLV